MSISEKLNTVTDLLILKAALRERSERTTTSDADAKVLDYLARRIYRMTTMVSAKNAGYPYESRTLG